MDTLRYKVDRATANKISCFTRHTAEYSGYHKSTSWEDTITANAGETTFYDSVTGKPLFIAPKGRTLTEFIDETKKSGWPSFREEELVTENVVELPNGEMVSSDGTHLGHNLPGMAGYAAGNRYCINLSSISGNPKWNATDSKLENE